MRLIDADFEIAHWESVLLDPTPDVTEKDKRIAPFIIDALKMAGTVKFESYDEEIKAKPCPHCGGEAELINTGTSFPKVFFRYACKSGCCMQSKLYETSYLALKDWNRRV